MLLYALVPLAWLRRKRCYSLYVDLYSPHATRAKMKHDDSVGVLLYPEVKF